MFESILKRSTVAITAAVVVATATKLGLVDKISEELAAGVRKVYNLKDK
jgi:hypothetical protein